MKPYAIIPFILQILAWPIAHLIFRINGTFTVEGSEHLKNIKGPFIIASNHANELDPVVQRAVLPMFSQPLFWVSRTRSFYKENNASFRKGWRDFLYDDWFFKIWGAYPAYKGQHDYSFALKHHVNIIKDGFSVGFFPQGGKGITLSEEESRKLPTHGGVVYLAQKTGVPIIPVTIQGTRGINFEKLFFKKTNLLIKVHQPIYIQTKDTVDYKERAEEVMKIIYAYYV